MTVERDRSLVGIRRPFSEQFKADATALGLGGEQSIAQVARDLGISAKPWEVGSSEGGAPGGVSGSC